MPKQKACPEDRLNIRLAHVVSLPERCSVITAALLAPLSMFFHQSFNSLRALKELKIAHIL